MAYSKKKSGSETRKRTPIIGFRATEKEREEIQAAASRAGLTIGSYVRSRALKKPTTRAVRRPPVETAQLAQLLGLLGVASGNIQLLLKRQGNREEIADTDVSAALTEFHQAAAVILRTLGKRSA